MKSKFLALVTMFLMSMSVYAQNITVRGNVTSEDDGGPIIGASILVQGTSNGTVTDLDGNFILENVKSGSNLIVSYVGMKSKTVKAAARLNISLSSETMALEEVVVTALGIQRQAKAMQISLTLRRVLMLLLH